jgi:hypothetical protein
MEVRFQERQSGLPLGQMPVTKAVERVPPSVALSVLAYLLLGRLSGGDETLGKEWSRFKLNERFIGEVPQEAVTRTERKWRRKIKQFKDVA